MMVLYNWRNKYSPKRWRVVVNLLNNGGKLTRGTIEG